MIASSCFADGWAGEHSYSSASDSGGGTGSGNYDKMISWVHFTYVGDKDGQSTWIVPQYAGDSGLGFKVPVVDGGEFNTCAGHIIDRPNHTENSNSHGNMELLQECYNNLFINGPVILKTGSTSGYNPVQLPRTFGGGSKPDGDSFVRAPETYVQRAEVFNYDPEIVEWAYNESRKEPQIVTTYTESLTPRL